MIPILKSKNRKEAKVRNDSERAFCPSWTHAMLTIQLEGSVNAHNICRVHIEMYEGSVTVPIDTVNIGYSVCNIACNFEAGKHFPF